MSTNEFINLTLTIMKTPYVIFITILSIFFISLANYVVHYKKKPPKVKQKKKKKVEQPAPQAEEPAEEEAGDE